jgi:hypothetical protein
MFSVASQPSGVASVNLLDNAVAAIQIGIEDFDSNDSRRQLSAIRNLYAGILLLCKAKLQMESPTGSDEVLLKERVIFKKQPDGSLTPKGVGKNTVDQQQIQQRLSDLGVKIDWQRLRKITDIRKNVEHYFFSGSGQHVREAVSEACVVIRQLVMDVLEQDPSKLIGECWWNRLFNVKEVFDQELKACRDSLSGVKWQFAMVHIADDLQCPGCESKLFRQANSSNDDPTLIQFRCTSCGLRTDGEDGIERLLEAHYAAQSFAAAKGECGEPLEDCPECVRHTYVTDEAGCALCGFEMPDDAECAVCGESLSVEDYGAHGNLCSYHAYVAEKERDR